MMGIGLYVQRCEPLDNEAKDECIKNEVAASVQQSPNMNVAYCVDALIVIENVFTLATNEEAAPRAENHTAE